ncbi:tRNA(Arg) A34 adenosine deaminase TadA [Paenarthrobacter nicotinovorans]|nr:tRNA(Arg) A34 adenosine deaminase TadA [Paenarthrobacter nicotinovorans]
MSAHSAHQRDEYLNRAIQLAVRNVADGGGPFGAIVVTRTEPPTRESTG